MKISLPAFLILEVYILLKSSTSYNILVGTNYQKNILSNYDNAISTVKQLT